jgi:hypothetical protein
MFLAFSLKLVSGNNQRSQELDLMIWVEHGRSGGPI